MLRAYLRPEFRYRGFLQRVGTISVRWSWATGRMHPWLRPRPRMLPVKKQILGGRAAREFSRQRSNLMNHAYKAYFVYQGYITDRIDLADCYDDETAKLHARRMAKRFIVELWDGNRMVAAFQPGHR
jgi:hypothetical protein